MRRRIAFILYLAWILLILGFTLQNGEASATTSKWYVEALHGLFMKIDLQVSLELLTTIIRKGAHFSEYAVLGGLSSMNARMNQNRLFYLSAFLPFLDETIQTQIDGRAGRFSDVLIDLSGYLLGYLIGRMTRKNAR
ncbi:MAG: VanZ family protein [Erysipelotrichaceae bacterium]|nr:VanZ family protein [Erysipelotrichaceae bacterium]